MGFFDKLKEIIGLDTNTSNSNKNLRKMQKRLNSARNRLQENASKIFKSSRTNKRIISKRKQKIDFEVIQKQRALDIEKVTADKQHQKGKLTARERIEILLDEGSFLEIGQFVGADLANGNFQGAAVVTGFGLINGTKVALYAQDFSNQGGSLGEVEGQKICRILDLALDEKLPIIAMLDSGGARIQEGVGALGYYGKIFARTVKASGVVPQISLILGPCAGGAVYCPALTDFIIMTRENSHMFVTGPDVVKHAIGEEISANDLGGGLMHSQTSGVCHHLADDEEGAIEYTRVLLSFLPSNFKDKGIHYTYEPNREDDKNQELLGDIVPEEVKQGYDMLDVIFSLVDYGEFLEVHELFAPSALVGFGRFNGQTVGIVANQPLFNAGTLDIDASEKIARFVRFCDAFNLPVITLVDVPGYRPGSQQEKAGIIRRGAKVITAYASASVPLITIILRKSYGGSYIVMGSKELGADLNFAWPTAQIAVLGAEGAVEIIHRRKIKEAVENGQNADDVKKVLIDEYTKKTINSHMSQEKGAIDGLIQPEDTRDTIIKSLNILKDKKVLTVEKKHDTQPL